jgi:hypothetical protein
VFVVTAALMLAFLMRRSMPAWSQYRRVAA